MMEKRRFVLALVMPWFFLGLFYFPKQVFDTGVTSGLTSDLNEFTPVVNINARERTSHEKGVSLAVQTRFNDVHQPSIDTTNSKETLDDVSEAPAAIYSTIESHIASARPLATVKTTEASTVKPTTPAAAVTMIKPPSTRENLIETKHVYVPSRTIEEDIDDPDCTRDVWRAPSLDALTLPLSSTLNLTHSSLDNRYLFDEDEVIENATSWWTPQQHCIGDCCSSTVLVPMKKTEHSLISTSTYVDLSDLVVGDVKFPGRPPEMGKYPPGFRHTEFNERMIPLLQPGTVFYVQMNLKHDEHPPKFIELYSRSIKVPHIIVIGNHDSELQSEVLEYLDEPNSTLMHIFSINTSPKVVNHPKITLIPIGMSTHGISNLIIQQVLHARNYANPYEPRKLRKCWGVRKRNPEQPRLSYRQLNERRIVEAKIEKWWGHNMGQPWELSNDMTVLKDGMKLHKRSPHWVPKNRGGVNGSPGRQQRPAAVEMACRNNTDNLTFCSAPIKTNDLITLIDRLNFGISPEGQGHDCYRTWEFLAMGMIPVTQKSEWHGTLYDGLPVVQLDTYNITHAQFKLELQKYVASKEFQEADFNGWTKLFAKHWWKSLYDVISPLKPLVMSPTGDTYYTKYKYNCPLLL